MRYPELLNEDISRVGDDARRYNLMSGRLVTDVVRTSLGPRGMEKMYIDILGEDTLTGHGGAFLRKIDTTHPAAKAVIEAVNAVDTHVGDGTATAAILIGEMLGQAEEMIRAGIPPATIVRGYEMGLDRALGILGSIEEAADRADESVMRDLAATCLRGKAMHELQMDGMDVVGMAIEAVLCVTDPGSGRVRVDDIKIEEKEGSIEQTELVRGTVIDKTIDSPAMPRRIENPRILLVNEALERSRTKTESEIEISAAGQMARFADQEQADVLALVDRVAESGATVVISRKGVSELAQERLAGRGIISMRRVKYNDLWWLEKATGARTCEDVGDISAGELGTAARIYERTVGEDRMVFVEAGGRPRSVTLLLRANSKRYLDEFHRNALNVFYALRNFIENPVVVYGGGAAEASISGKLRDWAAGVAGREQVAVQRMADCLERIALTLARNVGMDEIDTVSELRSRYAADGSGWYGIDSDSRRVADMSGSGIIEASDVKRQVLKSSVEAVNMILRIDDVFMKDLIDNTHCHIDGTVHAHRDGGKAHNHFEQEGLEQRQMHQYY
ncbi:Thermosome subunit beta [Nitrosopumilaceae archaeon]|nr:thermosome subunit [Nitrosopumilus sp.]CAI9832734.1 Thermosome subunit beta [Nitrosopumilaceae archaeon]MDA7944751.1 thermosome subunit [Nitrosopumilus sp.]MDA7955100.1 thermosome subunit [Nitrosopumilus sp.]MDA7974308.1 thermosome subunit [Nitrosopumilus sp.]